ncbi:translation elongation factor 4 [Thomasclavelia spiroformis]|uniref:translation elongation factor 4 n=1 Tax=Thomasclavelia spiroformis TaxID=29348 RepID=UPI00241E9AE4|nr:translation elongation factor 4 [Thomasclavelia spiroformis]MBS6114110.1 translation elongation factor 4 [Thomasclavelia spiroformis]
MTIDQSKIRNFSIIAHIDHGKSTLADRILQLTGAVADRDMKSQLLDSMDLERERGITIKLNAVQLNYTAKDGQTYLLHLIDTPGHVDFTYEVSRSLAACEGAILVVDAVQGVEAQTLANVYLALDNNLEILPVINKIDLPSADPSRVIKEVEDVIGLPADHAPLISAKTGLNIEEVLEKVVHEFPAPSGDINNPTQALIFDSYYDSYRGVIVFVRIKEGKIKVGDTVKFLATNAIYEVTELGVRTPREVKKEELVVGEVGWFCASIKSIQDIHVGDTVTTLEQESNVQLPGYRQLNPMMYCGLYPIDNARYKDLREALEKMKLSDSALMFEPETSQALGFGFRCGFLGLLHMDVIQERLEREFDLELIATAPSVIYHCYLTDGSELIIDNPAMMPAPQVIDHIEEPYVKASIMTPSEFVGAIMELCQNKRGEYVDIEYIDDTRRNVIYEVPLSEIVYDFFDKLKSSTKGYASLDYELIGYRTSKLQKMDILLNGDAVDALSTIVHKDFAYSRGKIICEKLKEIIPKQMFEVPIQAALQGKIIARTTIKAMRKNVLAKCYGGDITRKKKLLEKQKEGKKRMKAVGNVEIPQEAFMAILSVDDDK